MRKDEKPGRWSLFGTSGAKATEAEKRVQRIEELRRDLFRDDSPHVEYALNTLLSMLWVETETGRVAVACALSDTPSQPGKAEPPAFALRLCARLQTASVDPLAVPTLTRPTVPKDEPLRAWAEQALASILTDALHAIKVMLHQPVRPDADTLYRETDVCEDALQLGIRMKSPVLVDGSLRLLRLFTPDLARETGPFGRQTPELRALASQLLADLSPDDLYPLWVALAGPDPTVRRDLLPVLDYCHDARTVPYLIKLLERHGQWPDGDLVGWAALRALQRIGDRRALPALRRLVGEGERRAQADQVSGKMGNSDLIKAAGRAIESIEHKRLPAERLFLLRPSQPDTQHLLHPVTDSPAPGKDQAELLRTETDRNLERHEEHEEHE